MVACGTCAVQIAVQEIRCIALRLGQGRIQPAHVIAWSLWARAHQSTEDVGGVSTAQLIASKKVLKRDFNAGLHEVPGRRVLSVENGHGAGVVIRARGRRCAGRCPGCGTPSTASHGSYQRHTAYLPSLGRAVRFDLTVRRLH